MTKAESSLRKAIMAFLVQCAYYPSDIGDPACPLCRGISDFTCLEDEQVNLAWTQAATEYNNIWGEEYEPQEQAWEGLGCVQNWRQVYRERNAAK